MAKNRRPIYVALKEVYTSVTVDIDWIYFAVLDRRVLFYISYHAGVNTFLHEVRFISTGFLFTELDLFKRCVVTGFFTDLYQIIFFDIFTGLDQKIFYRYSLPVWTKRYLIVILYRFGPKDIFLAILYRFGPKDILSLPFWIVDPNR